MKCHQSPQTKHSHRLTELKKIEDKYNYNDISYPVACDDITVFEDNNNLMINVWKMEENGNIFLFNKGNVLNCKSGMINLLLILNKEGEGHYIYVKKLERMLHTTTCSKYEVSTSQRTDR